MPPLSNRPWRAALVVGTLMLLCGCGGKSPSSPTAKGEPVNNYTLSGVVRVDNGLGRVVPVPGIRLVLQQLDSNGNVYKDLTECETQQDGGYRFSFSDASRSPMRLKAIPDSVYARILDEDRMPPIVTSEPWTPSAENKKWDWDMAGENRKWFFVLHILNQCALSAREQFGTPDMAKIVCELEPGDPAHADRGWIGLGRDCWNNEDTIRHEYGHCHYVHIAGQFPPESSGSHNFGKETTPGCALSEGYATFYHCVTSGRKNYDYSTPAEPHDIDLESGSRVNSKGQIITFTGDRDEGSVCAVMVDIWDTDPEPGDLLSAGCRRVSDVIRFQKPDDFNQFYTYWNRNQLSQLVELRENLQNRKIYYGW